MLEAVTATCDVQKARMQLFLQPCDGLEFGVLESMVLATAKGCRQWQQPRKTSSNRKGGLSVLQQPKKGPPFFGTPTCHF